MLSKKARGGNYVALFFAGGINADARRTINATQRNCAQYEVEGSIRRSDVVAELLCSSEQWTMRRLEICSVFEGYDYEKGTNPDH